MKSQGVLQVSSARCSPPTASLRGLSQGVISAVLFLLRTSGVRGRTTGRPKALQLEGCLVTERPIRNGLCGAAPGTADHGGAIVPLELGGAR